MCPSHVNLRNASIARENLAHRYANHLTTKEPKYSVGDLVRISFAKNVFEKTYEGAYMEELFKIVRVSRSRPPI